MGTMPSSGAISFDDLRTQLGPGSGATSVSFSSYYRGGSYVPSTGTSGPYSTLSAPVYYWLNESYYGTIVNTEIWWNGSMVYQGSTTATSYVDGSDTYTRPTGSFYSYGSPDDFFSFYAVSKTSPKNTGVPTSGTISLSNMYGASNP